MSNQTRLAYFFLLMIHLQSCAISKPCSEGGDVSWNPKIQGDKKCAQKKLPNGKIVNDGKFAQAYQSNGKIALEGEFQDGRKSGIWLFYAENHQLIAAKYFDRGVEKTPPPEAQKQIDLLILQKTNLP